MAQTYLRITQRRVSGVIGPFRQIFVPRQSPLQDPRESSSFVTRHKFGSPADLPLSKQYHSELLSPQHHSSQIRFVLFRNDTAQQRGQQSCPIPNIIRGVVSSETEEVLDEGYLTGRRQNGNLGSEREDLQLG